MIRVQLGETLDEQKWSGLMVNESFTSIYFTVLQILRIAIDRINESVDCLMVSRAGFEWDALRDAAFCDNDIRLLHKNWDTLISNMQKRQMKLLDRINRKTEEVKSLRDGLFNAISLREATRGMALNRAIYVFTVITVIYTPIGFMDTFWAWHFFNNPSDDGTNKAPTAFARTFVVIPLLTYIISTGVVGYLTSKRIRGVVAELYYKPKHWHEKTINWSKRSEDLIKGSQRPFSSLRNKPQDQEAAPA